MDDLISRQAAIDAINKAFKRVFKWDGTELLGEKVLKDVPSAQPEQCGIPLEWIDKHLEWLDNCDNDFAQLAKVSIRAMVELWKEDNKI